MKHKTKMSILAKIKNKIREKIIQNKEMKIIRIVLNMTGVMNVKTVKGLKKFNSQKPTVIVVSHEASMTGAPILALNICQGLSNEYNILVVLIRQGDLTINFRDIATVLIRPRFKNLRAKAIENTVREFSRSYGKPKFAIINSIVSAPAIKPIRRMGIPVVSLIHEFSSYIKPLNTIEIASTWSNLIVFSSPLTKTDILNKCPQIKDANIRVLPQGKCLAPRNIKHSNETKDKSKSYLNEIEKDTFLILGAGQIQPRKGVDLFISVADRVLKTRSKCGEKIKFVWIGSGYTPDTDFNVSLWLKDQIERAGIEKQVEIINESDIYSDLIQRSNIFLMTSRLDPLPNVAIDALHAGKPVMCFRDACGIANIMDSDEEMKEYLVSNYLDTAEMASKLIYLLDNEDKLKGLARLSKAKGIQWFDMDIYINNLKFLGNEAVLMEDQMQEDRIYLESTKQGCELINQCENNRWTKYFIYKYLLEWQNEIWPRKPIPGYHPGIYRELVLANDRYKDPFVHYLKNGRPSGAWQKDIITPRDITTPNIQDANIALHIHVHYSEHLKEILNGIKSNTIKPDIYVTYNDKRKQSNIEKIFKESDCDWKQITLVPNRGRDIGALVTDLGEYLSQNYDVYGHVHTKKSEMICKKSGDSWRNFLIQNLLGTSNIAMADKIVTRLINDDRLGLVFADDPTCVGWTSNYDEAVKISNRLSIASLPEHFNFPVGTMFWAKKGVLNSLYKLKLNWNDYPKEPIKYDGTILHAIERMLPIIAEHEGFNYAMTHIPEVKR